MAYRSTLYLIEIAEGVQNRIFGLLGIEFSIGVRHRSVCNDSLSLIDKSSQLQLVPKDSGGRDDGAALPDPTPFE